MNRRKRIRKRDEVARVNGYRPTPLPPSPPWAGGRLSEPIDEAAARAARRLRGLPEKP